MIRLLLLLALFALPAQAQDADSRLQEALRLERSMGDYEGAISIYRSLAGDAAADRRVVAQALIQLGKAYESLGRTEAFDAYQRVARDFSDQEDLVAEARERMAGLAAEAAPVSPEQLDVAPELLAATWYSSLSSDGSTYVGQDNEKGLLAIQEIGSDVVTYLMPDVDYPDDFPRVVQTNGKFSPDGGRVAFTEWWGTRGDRGSVIWMWDRSSQTARELVEPGAWVEIMDWTPNAEAILVGYSDNEPNLGFQLIHAVSGSVRDSFILPITENWVGIACMINDDAMIVGLSSGVHVHDFSSGLTQRLWGGGAELMACSATQKIVVFRDEAMGERRVWKASIDAEMSISSPERLTAIHPNARILHLGSDGTIAYQKGGLQSRQAVYELDLELLQVSEETDVSPRGSTIAWTPDGTTRADWWGGNEFYLRTADSAHFVATKHHVWPRGITADGSMIVGGPTAVDRFSTYWYDAKSGIPVDSLVGIEATPGPVGQELWYTERRDETSYCLKARSPGETSEREIMCYADDRSQKGVSVRVGPDDQKALVQTRNQDASAIIVNVIDLASGEVWEIGEFNWYWDAQWLPDGRVLILRNFEDTGAEFMIYSTDGREKEEAFQRFTEGRRVARFAVHPSEPRIALNSWYPRELSFEGIRIVRDAW